MPKVSVLNSSLVVIVSLEKPHPKWEEHDWVLDSSGFPWAVHAILEGELLLMPMRELPDLKHQIGTLVPYEEGTADAYLNRVFDYMSHIEDRDVEVMSVRSGTWFESWGESEWVVNPHHDFKHDSTVAPKDTVVITDYYGIEWGPLPCDLAVAQDPWPYKGGIKSHDITFEPHEGRSDWWTLKMGKLQIDVHGSDRLTQLVLELRDSGWLKMIENNFASGLKLEPADRTVPTADEDDA